MENKLNLLQNHKKEKMQKFAFENSLTHSHVCVCVCPEMHTNTKKFSEFYYVTFDLEFCYSIRSIDQAFINSSISTENTPALKFMIFD